MTGLTLVYREKPLGNVSELVSRERYNLICPRENSPRIICAKPSALINNMINQIDMGSEHFPRDGIYIIEDYSKSSEEGNG